VHTTTYIWFWRIFLFVIWGNELCIWGDFSRFTVLSGLLPV
jgi:hypothetical protein